jgi:alpha-glucosidase (family GH31 glycosyl hydrolase)
MISPVMEPNVSYVDAYFPRGRWYDFFTGLFIDSPGQYQRLHTPLDKIQLHVRGGYIIPWQQPANTTVYSRTNPLGLFVATGPQPTDVTAGNLFWDDGESYETFVNDKYLLMRFESRSSGLEIQVLHNTYQAASSLILDTVDIWGLGHRVSHLTVNGLLQPDSHIEYDSVTQNVRLINLALNITFNYNITWQLESGK